MMIFFVRKPCPQSITAKRTAATKSLKSWKRTSGNMDKKASQKVSGVLNEIWAMMPAFGAKQAYSDDSYQKENSWTHYLSKLSFGPGIAWGIQSFQDPGSWSNPTDYGGQSLQKARVDAKGVCSDEIEGSRWAAPYFRCSWNRFPFPGKLPRITDYECADATTNCEVGAVFIRSRYF